jgi:hypothetical protein
MKCQNTSKPKQRQSIWGAILPFTLQNYTPPGAFSRLVQRKHKRLLQATTSGVLGCHMQKVGQNHIYTEYKRCFWLGNIYAHIYTVLANPTRADGRFWLGNIYAHYMYKRSYTLYIYSSGQPYTCRRTRVQATVKTCSTAGGPPLICNNCMRPTFSWQGACLTCPTLESEASLLGASHFQCSLCSAVQSIRLRSML